jgi:hypothetical protein
MSAKNPPTKGAKATVQAKDLTDQPTVIAGPLGHDPANVEEEAHGRKLVKEIAQGLGKRVEFYHRRSADPDRDDNERDRLHVAAFDDLDAHGQPLVSSSSGFLAPGGALKGAGEGRGPLGGRLDESPMEPMSIRS